MVHFVPKLATAHRMGIPTQVRIQLNICRIHRCRPVQLILIGFFFILILKMTVKTHFGFEMFEENSWNKFNNHKDPNKINAWIPVGHTNDQQRRLRILSWTVMNINKKQYDRIPTVPCISSDKHLLVLSAAASRVRYGHSVTFMLVFPNITQNILLKDRRIDPMSPTRLLLWCIFEDGSTTIGYTHEFQLASESVSLVDCPISQYAAEQLWSFYRTIRVYVASLTDPNQRLPIFKALVSAPRPANIALGESRYQLTLCLSPVRDRNLYIPQWIEYHRMVGFRKFVIYNTTDSSKNLQKILNAFEKKYPNLVDVVQWNFSSIGLKDPRARRYFQVEAAQDCLIRYGDQSEWLGMLDLDEYLVPLPPYQTITDYLINNFAHRIVGSLNFWSYFFRTVNTKTYTAEEKNTSRLVIERFVLRDNDSFKAGRHKYLYRPRFVYDLSIHFPFFGYAREQSSPESIRLAHYISMERIRSESFPNESSIIQDLTVRDRFAKRIRHNLNDLFSSKPY